MSRVLISESMNGPCQPKSKSFKLNRVLSATMTHIWCNIHGSGLVDSTVIGWTKHITVDALISTSRK